MTPAEILRAAKAKIEDPKHWCQGMYATDANMNPVWRNDPTACRWCSVSAVRLVASYEARQECVILLHEAADDVEGFAGAFDLNDNSDHATVMKMFDRAIELAEQAEAANP